MTKRILNSLTIGKIAAVDVPCQEGAQALILKRAANADTSGADTSTETGAENFEGQLAQENLWDSYGRAQSALQQSIESIMGDDSVADKGAMIQRSLDEFCEYIGQLVPPTHRIPSLRVLMQPYRHRSPTQKTQQPKR